MGCTPWSFANAKTVFFWVSVVRTFAWSPVVWAASKEPRRWVETLRSVISWRAVPRWIRTTRVSALPYRFAPRRMAMSAPSVGGVGERGEQQRHVVVLVRRDPEAHGDPGEERVLVIGADVEGQGVGPRLHPLRPDAPHPAVVVGDRLGEEAAGTLEADGDPGGRSSACRVEDVRGDPAHPSSS